MGVGTNLKRLRNKTKLSQQEIADKLDIDRATYINWENGTFDVKSQYIPKLAEIFDVELHEFFKDDQKIHITNNIENKDKTGTGGVGVQKGKIIINMIITDESSAIKLSEQLEKLLHKK
ncbi:helix-turn-helix transcriptional regulator [Chryseobacterium sp. Mn2064]|uniref:helix-turn-helix transcriptional regulator n=1 Tax=Chryseobacterium sp. Mn2064 TaxID=3395263 RepID=UPI003BD40110